MKQTSKIVLIGSGVVGSTFAYTVLLMGLAHELVIIDVNRDKAEGDVLDLNHGLMLAHPMKIKVGDYADCAGADIVVITAGAAQRPGESRTDLLQRNISIFGPIVEQVVTHCRKGILLVAANPVDVLSQVALKRSGWPAHRVIGSGTLLDSSRFRYLVGERLGVDPRSVHGVIVGEHGDSEVPVWSGLNVAGVGPGDTPPGSRWHLTEEDKRVIYEATRGAAGQIIAKKGATYYAIALALARICDAILRDQHSVLPVSVFAQEYGVYLGLPAVIGRSGVEEVIVIPLSEEERGLLQASAAKLRGLLTDVGI